MNFLLWRAAISAASLQAVAMSLPKPGLARRERTVELRMSFSGRRWTLARENSLHVGKFHLSAWSENARPRISAPCRDVGTVRSREHDNSGVVWKRPISVRSWFSVFPVRRCRESAFCHRRSRCLSISSMKTMHEPSTSSLFGSTHAKARLTRRLISGFISDEIGTKSKGTALASHRRCMATGLPFPGETYNSI